MIKGSLANCTWNKIESKISPILLRIASKSKNLPKKHWPIKYHFLLFWDTLFLGRDMQILKLTRQKYLFST